nr:hypothetical protein [Candidatus Sigynarchaeota archaeon]
MDAKIKTLVIILMAVTFLSIGISYLQYAGLGNILTNMSPSP